MEMQDLVGTKLNSLSLTSDSVILIFEKAALVIKLESRYDESWMYSSLHVLEAKEDVDEQAEV